MQVLYNINYAQSYGLVRIYYANDCCYEYANYWIGNMLIPRDDVLLDDHK